MAANEALKDLSTTDASNTPAGTDAVAATVDDEVRSLKANIARSARWEVTATVSAAYSLGTSILHKIIPADTTTTNFTMFLPSLASAGDGFVLKVRKTAGANTLTIQKNSADGAVIISPTTGATAGSFGISQVATTTTLMCNGSLWYVDTNDDLLINHIQNGGTSTLSGAVVAKTTLNAVGAVTFDDTVTVSGAVVAKTTLNAVGAATFDGTVTVSGAVVCTTTFNAKGAATFDSSATFSGNVTFNGPVDYLNGSGNFGLNDGLLTHTGPVTLTNAQINMANIPVYDTEASASAAFLSTGRLYKTSTGALRIKL